MRKSSASHITDEQLFSRIAYGDEEAFTQIYNKYHKVLYVMAYRYLMSHELAEDAVQTVFVRLWEYRSELKVSISLKNFLFTMTKNHVLNMIRDENTILMRQYEMAQTAFIMGEEIVDKMEKNEKISLLYKALKLLPMQKRKVCLMKMNWNMTNQSIADSMNLSVNTIKTHYSDALKFIRKYMKKMLIFAVCIICI